VIEIINGRIIDWVQSVKITGFIKSGYPYKRGNLYFITHAVDDETYLINTLSNQQIVGIVVDKTKEINISQWIKAGIGIIEVENVRQAFCQIVKFVRKSVDIPLIAVIGSLGKTNTKDMVNCILKEKFNCLVNNTNNHHISALSYYLLKLDRTHRACILETKITHKTMIPFLSNIMNPMIYVLTQIEQTDANLYLEFEANMKNNQLLIIDGDCTNCTKLIKEKNKANVYRYGLTSDSDIYATDVMYRDGKTKFIAHFKEVKLNCIIHTFGNQQVKNALSAILVGILCGLSDQLIIKGLASYHPLKGRCEMFVGRNHSCIINDQYDTSVMGIKCLLDDVKKIADKRPMILVLGDLEDTLNKSEKYQNMMHQEVGRNTKSVDYTYLIAVGKYGEEIIKGALQTGAKEPLLYHFKTINEFIPYIKQFILKDSVIVVKTHFQNIDMNKALLEMM